MIENTLGSIEESTSIEEVSDISAGALLRKAREAEGLNIAALAVSLKVPVKKLEALEADHYELLPDIVFARALASSVCRTLKIDSSLILSRLPTTVQRSLVTDSAGINTPFRTSTPNVGAYIKTQLGRPFVVLIALLLLGVFVMVFLPTGNIPDISVAVKSNDAAALSSGGAIEEQKTLNTYIVSTDSTATENSGDLISAVSNPTQTIPESLGLVSSADSGAVVAPIAKTTGESTIINGLVVFTARGSSWIEVVDSQGVVQVRKTLVSGDVIAASGAVPLSVVVGRADTTDVQVRGMPFDLLRIARDNVARFEVK